MVQLTFFPTDKSSSLKDYWLNFANDPEPSVRDKMLYLTMREIAEVGPGSFNTMGVCDALDVTYPMVNHYFGNRDGLVAEAGFLTYKRYIELIWVNVQAAESDPVSKLRAWIKSQVALNAELGGWGAILNYSPFSQSIFKIMEEKFGKQRQKLFELNMIRLSQLIRGVRENKPTNIEFTLENYNREEFFKDQKLLELTSSVVLATLGLAVWKSGGHAPSQGIPEVVQLGDRVAEAHVENIVKMVKNS